jgi:hypothetical protein
MTNPKNTQTPVRLREHGFWDYTTPLAGGMEQFQKEDYELLLDDMAGAGMNSLLVCVKWMTTGYRSALPFLDQPSCPVTDSDNELLRWVIREAAARRIKVWLSAVVSFNACGPWGSRPQSSTRSTDHDFYDADSPLFTERAVAVFEELVDLFPGIGGLMVEVEGSGEERPHRIPLYNAWAASHGAPPFEKIGHPFNPRALDAGPWRDYATWRRLEILQAIQGAVRAKGFGGDMSMICETGESEYAFFQEVNLKMFRERFPDWIALTYAYNKSCHRYGEMEVCLAIPKQMGLTTYYLPRGVMTWGLPLPTSLEENWRMDVEDIRQFQPDGVWWFGCGTVSAGIHVDLALLRQSGYADGTAARRALLQTITGLRT